MKQLELTSKEEAAAAKFEGQRAKKKKINNRS